MVKKHLQEWYNNNDITYYEKERLNKIGVSNYDYHKLSDLRKMLRLEEIARANKSKFLMEGGWQIKKIIFFSTWWNSNCALIVYRLWFIPTSPFVRNLSFYSTPNGSEEINQEKVDLMLYEGGNVYSKNIYAFSSISREGINSLIRKLNGSNPILAVTSELSWEDNCPSFVKGFCLDYNEYRPSKDIKVLSIIRVEKPSFSHVGVYLGKDNYGNHKVAHIAKTDGNSKAEIANWNELFKGSPRAVSYYYPIIPYKETQLIKKHIARATTSEEYREYDMFIENCQHFANKCVLGIDFSQDATIIKINDNLKKEIENANWHFNNLTITSNSELENNQHKIEECLQNSQNNWEDKFEAHIEIVPSCKLQ